MFKFVRGDKKMPGGLERMKQRVTYTGYDRADNWNVSRKYKSFAAAIGL